MMKSLIGAALAASVLAGCATPYGYSQLYGRRYNLTPIDTYPVIISKVDGRSYVSNPVLVEPGEHKVLVQAPPGATGVPEERSVNLMIQPCTRYYLVAVKDNRLDRDFSVRIDYQEPVSGCTPPG